MTWQPIETAPMELPWHSVSRNAIVGANPSPADARLIAAAPELLSALEKVFTVMNDDMPVGLRKVCYEAIAKAKGE